MSALFLWITILAVTWVCLKLSGITVSFNVLPLFLPDEKVLFFKRWVWAASGKSLPTYRGWFSAPPFIEHGLYITDKRVLHVFLITRIIKQEESQWFKGMQGPENNELVKDVNCGNSLLFGPYLDIFSENLFEKRWYRSPELRIRLFMKKPEFIREIIAKAMLQNH